MPDSAAAVAEKTDATATADTEGTVLGKEPAAKADAEGAAPGTQSEADKAAAAKTEADKKVADQAAQDKELEGKTDAEKQAILKNREDAKKAAEKTEAEKKQGAPEKYADFKLPEGIAPDAEALKDFAAVAKELDLSQDKAQKLVDLQTKIIAREQQNGLASFQKLKADWLDESKKAFGAEYEKEFATASKAIERFGTPQEQADLRKALNESGLGNHPAFMKWANRIGKAVSEDKFVEGGAGPGAEKSTKELFYGSTMGQAK
jgi:hypothetical protein